MKTGTTGINLIKHYESLHDGDLKQIGLQPKMCPAGVWTEGWGRAMRDSKGKFLKGADAKKTAYSHITIHNKEEADKALLEDLVQFEGIVKRKVTSVLNQNQFDALVSHVYNTGGSETLYSLINKEASEKEIRAWWEHRYITSEGVILKGLVLRRKTESDLFFTK